MGQTFIKCLRVMATAYLGPVRQTLEWSVLFMHQFIRLLPKLLSFHLLYI